MAQAFMKIFHCDHCQQLVFFENIRCLRCDHALAFLPDIADIGSLEPIDERTWRSLPNVGGRTYRLCDNYSRENVCNWAVPADDPQTLCSSCRLTRVIPDLTQPGNKEAWYKLEVAKRRLVYSLMMLKLPLLNKADEPEQGLAFEFLSDPAEPEAPPVFTGHTEGVITINIAEANDAERERRRLAFREPYRTLLGHFRHETGHYYWDRLIRNSDRLEKFREVFGDERTDYGEALKKYYDDGAPPQWQENFISAYATAHPWEDWAESWAHYLHMTDTLETAAATGLTLKPGRKDEPTLSGVGKALAQGSFERMVQNWFPVTYVLNNLNRGLGLADGYPFVLSDPVIAKLRFVHETVTAE
jgi:hypothetical protein